MNKLPVIAALVPMRHHSERVKQKNYRDFNGKPLFAWVLETLAASDMIAQIVINTDSPVIKEKAPAISGKIRILQRPQHLCAGEIPMNDILLHDVAHVEADYYLQTHSTNPLLRQETIERAIKAFLEQKEYDSLFSVTRWQTRLWDQQGRPINHDPQVLVRTQDLPPVFEENSNLYLFTKDILQKRKSRIGEKPMLFEIELLEAWDIDEEEDFILAELIQQQRYRSVTSS